MKRRNADSGKMRRPLKRNKITEGIYGSTLLYLKFLLLWATVMFADYMSEFRFEFLWSLWMMLRSVYDSFKYQGLAFSVFFIFIALTSDVICFIFVPVQWILFIASTYVWVQYLWCGTDKGICVPTVALCAAVVWAEAGLRGPRDPRQQLFPSQLALCRPFAAHCVGYPAVSLGFGLRGYLGHRLRERRQRDVRNDNRFYYQLLRQALPDAPPPQPAIKDSPEKPPDKSETEHKPHMNGNVVNHNNVHSKSKKSEAKVQMASGDPPSSETSNGVNRHTDHVTSNHTGNHNHSQSNGAIGHPPPPKEKAAEKNHSGSNGVIPNHMNHVDKASHRAAETSEERADRDKEPVESTKSEIKVQNDPSLVIEAVPVEKTKCMMKTSSKWERKENAANAQREERRKVKNKDKDGHKESHKEKDGHKESHKEKDGHKESHKEKDGHKESHREKEKDNQKDRDHNDNHKHTDSTKETPPPKEREIMSSKEERRQEKEREKEREREAKEKKEREKEREKLQSKELEEREKWWSGELKKCRAELSEARAAEAEARAELRRALATCSQQERQRTRDTHQLRRTNEELHAKLNTVSNWRSAERAEKAALERRLAEERRARAGAEQRLAAAPAPTVGPCARPDCRAQAERRRREPSPPPAAPAPAPAAPAAPAADEAERRHLAERAALLERSLSAETRVKLDLFSALGEAKRQLQIKGGLLYSRDKEIDELKSKIAQMLAVMPPDSFVSPLSGSSGGLRGAVGLEGYARDA